MQAGARNGNLMNISTIMQIMIFMLGLSMMAQASNAQADPDCVFPNSSKAAPDWVCDAPVEGVEVSAVGSKPKSGAGLAFMKQMAATDARVQLAQQMKVHVANQVKQYMDTTGEGNSKTADEIKTSVTKQVTSESLSGTQIFRSIVAPDGTMYVLVGVDTAAVHKLSEAAIKASMKTDAALWQKFKASK